MSVYPGTLDTFTTKVAKVDLYRAAHMNDVQAAIVAVETELGTDPAASETDLKTRLNAALNADGTLKTGFSVASGTITTLTATTVGCNVVGNHPHGTTTPLQRVPTDSAQSGGNARGNYAVDLQTWRTLAQQVASGTQSVLVGGANNTVSGAAAVVIGGQGNTASGGYATISGGDVNTAGPGSSATIAGGDHNTVSCSYWGTVSGGTTNTASGYYGSLVAGGNGNTASANYSAVSGGQGNLASGAGSIVLAGRNNTASGYYAQASGRYSKADKYGQSAQASGQFSAQGDAQTSRLVLRKQTTNATQAALALNGSTTQIDLDEDATYFLEAHVVARRTDADNESAAYVIRWCVDRNTAGAAALVGAIDYDLTIEDTAAWACVVDVNGNNTRILVTGEAGKTIRWVATVFMTEVHG